MSEDQDYEILISISPSGLTVKACSDQYHCDSVSTLGSMMSYANEWMYFAFTHDSDGSCTLFSRVKDSANVFQLNKIFLNYLTFLERSQNSIGRDILTSQFFNGDLDNLRIWSRLLTQSDFSNSPLGYNLDGCIGEWKFDIKSGSDCRDDSGNDKNGCLGGNDPNNAPIYITSGVVSRTCSIWGHGRIDTFDQYPYNLEDYFKYGADYLLVNDTNFQIQGRFQSVGEHFYLSGVAFQVNSNIMVFDLDYSTKFTPTVTLNAKPLPNYVNSLSQPFNYQFVNTYDAYKYIIDVPDVKKKNFFHIFLKIFFSNFFFFLKNIRLFI